MSCFPSTAANRPGWAEAAALPTVDPTPPATEAAAGSNDPETDHSIQHQISGDADGESDIDLLLVVADLDSPDLAERLPRLGSDMRAWTGNDLQVVEHDESSWRAIVGGENPLVDQVRREGVALTADADLLLRRQR